MNYELEIGNSFLVKDNEAGFDKEPFSVTKKHKYELDNYFWYEYELSYRGKKLYMEIEIPYVFFSLKELSLDQLNLNITDVVANNLPNSISFEGLEFLFQEYDEAAFLKNCREDRKEYFTYFDFKNGDNFITIEVWGKNDIEIFLSTRMSYNNLIFK